MWTKRYRATIRRERLRFLLAGSPAFGSSWHHFKRGARCSREHVASFEARFRISLPHEFKRLLIDVGNGVPGPYYGLSRLEDWSQPWETTEVDPSLLARPFAPDGPTADGLYPGALRLCNAGCEHYALLVVSGAHAGEIWHDASADELGAFPVLSARGGPASLSVWMTEWLEALPNGDWTERFWSSHDFDGHAVAQVLESSTEPLTAVAVDQLPCRACVRRLCRQQTVPRILVPTPRPAEAGQMNPKRAAILAARGELSVVPRQVIPSPRRLLA